MSIIYTLISALLISISQITSKIGIKNNNIYLSTLIKSIVIFIISIFFINKIKFNIYIIISSIALTLSWIYYFISIKNNKLIDIIPLFLLSTTITLLLNLIIFKDNIKLISFGFILIGNIIIIRKFDKYALLQALFASLHLIFLKLSNISVIDAIFINSLIATIILLIIIIIKKNYYLIPNKKNITFLIISGILTTFSWLLYYKAIQIGSLNIIVPLEKINILITILFTHFILKEKVNKKIFIGLAIMTIGTILSMI